MTYHICSAQISTAVPQHWINASGLFIENSSLELSNNLTEHIQQELLDTNIIRIIVNEAGLTEPELATVAIATWGNENWLTLFQLKEPDKAFTILKEKLYSYIQARSAGHTKEFLLSAITNHVPSIQIADADLRVLLTNRPFIPTSLAKKVDSGTQTNKARQIKSISTTTSFLNGKMQTTIVTNMPNTDEICRWVTYEVTDGEIAWSYTLQFKSNGGLDNIFESRQDAKEFNPKFQKVIREVEGEVKAEMKRNGTLGKFGSIHEFWSLKKDKLKAKGISWSSPAELNPGSSFD